MRLFVAIDIPDNIQQEISRLYCKFHGVTWSPPERLHITLAFLGEVKTSQLSAVDNLLRSITFQPFQLSCDHFGSFNSGDIWLGVTPEEQLVALHQQLRKQLDKLGLGYEGRPFKPHITLAYTAKNEESLVLRLLESRRHFDNLNFEVDHFNLKSSWTRPAAALHRIEQIYPAHT